MGNGHMETPPSANIQTDTSENITFPQLHWQRVDIKALFFKYSELFSGVDQGFPLGGSADPPWERKHMILQV